MTAYALIAAFLGGLAISVIAVSATHTSRVEQDTAAFLAVAQNHR